MDSESQNSSNSTDSPMPIKIEDKKGWEKIGLHRPIASFWYQFILLLIVAIPALLMYSFILPNYILPYPEALGFQSLTTTYFALFFSLMDVATGPACERFVAQYAEINPKKALKYVQFFIWFQMTTGLIQITAITFFAFTYLVHTNLSYALWFFLLYSTTQYPGMLGVYNSTLKGYQRFDKANIVTIIQGILFENVTQIIFILIGRWWGASNPAIGELYGATMGYIIGRYIDDFIAMGLSAYYVSNLLRPYGISLIETIIPNFGIEEVKNSLSFGVKLIGAEVISYFTEYITLLMMIEWVPNYISIIAYLQIAKTVADIVGTRYNFTALLSESYNNGKKALTQYIITSYFKHWWYLGFALTLQVSLMVPKALELLGGDWGRAAWIIPIYIFPRLLVQPPVMGADILNSCDKPFYRTLGIVSEKITKMLTVLLWLSPIGLVSIIGSQYMIILYVLHDIPAYIVITIVELFFVHKLIVPVRINWWQTFIAGTLASIPILPLNFLMLYLIDTLSGASLGILVGIMAAYVFIMLLIFPMFIFFFYGLFGGWDDIGLLELKNAVPLTGPSQFLMKIYYKFTEKGHELSPLANRFPTPHEKAYEEIEELMEIMYPKTE